ncbi:hypothetical protein Tco_0743412 [Tanacetum coccineum]
MPSPENPPSPDYVPKPEYLEYLVPSDDEVPIEDQPLHADTLPTALSLGYVADSDPEEDLEEDPREDHADYHGDGGDDDEEEDSSDDDDDEEEEEHLAPVNFSDVPIDDHRPMAVATEALIAAVADALPSSSPPPSPLSPWSSPLPQIPYPPLPLPSPPTSPTYAEAPLGYRAAIIRSRAASPSTHHPSEIPLPPLLLPSTTRIDDILKADMPLRKRAHFTAPTGRFEVGESSAAAAARQPGLDVTHATNYSFVDTMDATPGRPMPKDVGYGIMDVCDDMVRDMEERAPTTLEELSQRVTDLAATLVRDTHEIEARYARQAWSQAMDCNKAVHAELLAYQAEGHDQTREPEPARDLEHHDGPLIMPPRRNTAANAPMSVAGINQLIEERVAEALAN